MKLKLSRAEMRALEMCLSSIINEGYPEEILHKLLMAIMKKLYEKVAKDLVVLKNAYSIKLDDVTALAFTLLFSHVEFNPTNHADNLILKIVNKFQQHYA